MLENKRKAEALDLIEQKLSYAEISRRWGIKPRAVTRFAYIAVVSARTSWRLGNSVADTSFLIFYRSVQMPVTPHRRLISAYDIFSSMKSSTWAFCLFPA